MGWTQPEAALALGRGNCTSWGLWERVGFVSSCVGVGLRPSNLSHIISKPWDSLCSLGGMGLTRAVGQ